MLYNRCTGIYKSRNNTDPRRIRSRSNLGQIFSGKRCVLWAGKYGTQISNFMKIRPVGAELFREDGQTDRQT